MKIEKVFPWFLGVLLVREQIPCLEVDDSDNGDDGNGADVDGDDGDGADVDDDDGNGADGNTDGDADKLCL